MATEVVYKVQLRWHKPQKLRRSKSQTWSYRQSKYNWFFIRYSKRSRIYEKHTVYSLVLLVGLDQAIALDHQQKNWGWKLISNIAEKLK